MASSQPLDRKHAPDDLEHAFAGELRFIAEWESGTMPFLGAVVRIRQLRRVHPWMLDR